MGKVKSRKKQNNSKAKKKKELVIGPRRQLEPTLNPKTSKPDEKEHLKNAEKNLLGKDVNEIVYLDQLGSVLQNSSMIINDNDESAINSKTSANFVQSQNRDIAIEKNNVEDSKIGSRVEHCNPRTIEKVRPNLGNPQVDARGFLNIMNSMKQRNKRTYHKKTGFKSAGWSSRELMDLAIGLQSKGFADLNTVAECIKTKKENEIRVFLDPRVCDTRRTKTSVRGRPANKFHSKSPEIINTWPNVRKWRRLAFDHMLNHARRMDYSKTVMEALCKKFYEEEKETTDPEVINVKLIYKYMMDCMAGNVPPQLPPKESALVLDLLREVRLLPIAYDFEEERKFLNDFKSPTKFKPFHVKDEFKKRFKKETPETSPEANIVSVPEEVFLELSRHKKVTQCFNPLVTPVWMLQKEQECLEKYQKESNVYVD